MLRESSSPPADFVSAVGGSNGIGWRVRGNGRLNRGRTLLAGTVRRAADYSRIALPPYRWSVAGSDDDDAVVGAAMLAGVLAEDGLGGWCFR